MIEKRILIADRVRRPPRSGFSWIDRRFLREHARHLSRDAILIYFFLAAVSDRDGLSYWKDVNAAAQLKTATGQLVRAREELVGRDLVAFSPPLTQVLSLSEGLKATPEQSRMPCGPPQSLGDVLAEIVARRTREE